MTNALSYNIKSDVLYVYTNSVWCLKQGDGHEHKNRVNIQAKIEQLLNTNSVQKIVFHFESKHDKLSDWDSLLLAFFSNLMAIASEKNIDIDISNLPNDIRQLLNVKLSKSSKEAEPDNSILVNIGEAVVQLPLSSFNALEFLGEITVSIGRFIRGKAKCSARDIWQEIYISSAASLPIISLVSLLLGMILAFVSAIQLRNLGAELYVASLVTISMVRVMGPVLTGIVVAGKTGASYAATIGTMQVNEEIDALKTFDISPFDFLVLPRVLALSIMMPFLTMYSNAMGVLGGFLVAVLGMDISPAAFVENVQFMGSMDYLWTGLFHAFVFGFLIALCGCYQGITCGRSAEAVGKATTHSVVNSIIGIIVSTSIITVILTINHL